MFDFLGWRGTNLDWASNVMFFKATKFSLISLLDNVLAQSILTRRLHTAGKQSFLGCWVVHILLTKMLLNNWYYKSV